MKLVHSVQELRSAISDAKRKGASIGFVPTMGALHEGHASLMHAARENNDFVVLSIFVNPTQFGANEDFSKYPRTLPEDCKIAENAGVDLVFAPSSEEVYPPGFETFVEVGSIAAPLCGKFRPGHFRGVATVVNRLFQLVEPTRAYFGQKDIQQCLVLIRMVQDFGTNVELVICPTLREKDGLAMSSRNRYMSAAEREEALVIYRAMQAVKQAKQKGETSVEKLVSLASLELKKSPSFTVQYVEILSYPDLKVISDVSSTSVLAIAGFMGKTRLIDNEILEQKP
jgi:pantoate--beta-alanine ligase